MIATAKKMTIPGYIKKSELPNTGKDWISVSPDVEFQPSAESDSNPHVRNALERLLKGSTSEYENQFIDGTETYYNDYAQAWRLLGFYTDCNAPHNNYNECSDDQDGGNDDDQPACQRYLMWAAYIDLDYAGGKIGEYQFYDRATNSWDTTSCVAQGGRCAKMDCHVKGTNFKLLGFFKEPNYHEWMEQLFKHAGVCIWTDNEYSFMDVDRTLWPCACTNTYATGENGNYLYYDTKPMQEGRISLGLYTDDRCSEDYMGSMNVAEVLEAYVSGDQFNSGDSGNAYELEEGLAKWNDAFDAFKVCQPCKAYDLGFNSNSNGNREGGGGDDDGSTFDCYDDAGYTDVNQCMKFRTKTEMLPADFRDIMIAHQQGTIVRVEVLGQTYGSGGYGRLTAGLATKFTLEETRKIKPRTFGLLVGSMLVCLVGAVTFWKAKKEAAATSTMETPLVASSGVIS